MDRRILPLPIPLILALLMSVILLAGFATDPAGCTRSRQSSQNYVPGQLLVIPAPGQSVAKIQSVAGVDDVVTRDQTYGHVLAIADLIKILGLSAVVILSIITAFIIGNAIRLTLFARRREIQIMQLVGATNWFIKAPLIIEGIVLGALGAIIAAGIVIAGSDYVAHYVLNRFPLMLRDVSSGVTLQVFISTLVCAGAIIGAAGSFVSARRFLKF